MKERVHSPALALTGFVSLDRLAELQCPYLQDEGDCPSSEPLCR